MGPRRLEGGIFFANGVRAMGVMSLCPRGVSGPVGRAGPRIRRVASFVIVSMLRQTGRLRGRNVSVVRLRMNRPSFSIPTYITRTTGGTCSSRLARCARSLNSPRLEHRVTSFRCQRCNIGMSPGYVIIASNSSPTVLLMLLLLYQPSDRIVLSGPKCTYCHGFILTTRTGPMLIPLHRRGNLRCGVRSVGGFVAAHATTVFVGSPVGPAKLLLRSGFLGRVTSLNIPIVSSRVCRKLICRKHTHDVLRFASRTFILGNFSGHFTVAKLQLKCIVTPGSYVQTLRGLRRGLFVYTPDVTRRTNVTTLHRTTPSIRRVQTACSRHQHCVVRHLHRVKFNVHIRPGNTFCVFTSTHGFAGSSCGFTFRILRRTRMNVAPKISFNAKKRNCMHFSCTGSLRGVHRTLSHLGHFLLSHNS